MNQDLFKAICQLVWAAFGHPSDDDDVLADVLDVNETAGFTALDVIAAGIVMLKEERGL